MKTIALLTLPLVLLLSNCAPRAIVVEPAAAQAARVTGAAADVTKKAKKNTTHTEEIGKQVDQLSQEMLKNKMVADAQRKAGLATPEQLVDNVKAWDAAIKRTEFLEAALQVKKIDDHELEEAANTTSAEAVVLENKTVKNDKVVVDLKGQLAAQEVDAARGRMVKGIFWAVIIGAVLILGLLIFLKFTAAGARLLVKLP